MTKKSPGVILTSQFTTPEKNSFTRYFDYMTRKEALLEKEKHLTVEEQKELSRLNNHIKRYEIQTGITESTLKNRMDLNPKEIEASQILQTKEYFKNTEVDFTKYISYMARQYALEKKNSLTSIEEKELLVVRKKINAYVDSVPSNTKDNENSSLYQSGVFSIDKERLTNKDLEEVKTIVDNAQKSGSIFFQDVISFDNDFLVKEKLLNPKTNELNENRLQAASRKMMDKMFEDEGIDQGYWFATIHRNTKHVHIHYGTVEPTNTRTLIVEKENGVEYLSPKGKRKQKTIDNMKSTFANSLIDRTSELSRISNLRNELVHDIKDIYQLNGKEKKEIQLLKELQRELPSNKKYWQYGSKHLSSSSRKKIDQVVSIMMEDNPKYNEFFQKTEEESRYRKELFGESGREDKDYAKNKEKEIQKRLGNSLLKEMKKNSSVITNTRELKETRYNTRAVEKEQKEKPFLEKKNPPRKAYPNKINLYQLKKVINDDFEKYQAERDYEYVKQRIAWEQQSNEL